MNKKKHFCKPADGFTFEELEKEIGHLEGKYDAKLFEMMKKLRSNPEWFLFDVRMTLIFVAPSPHNESFFLEYLMEKDWDDPLFDEMDEDAIEYVLTSDEWCEASSKIDSCYHYLRVESRELAKKIFFALKKLGYIREDFGDVDKKMLYFCPHYREAMIDYLLFDSDVYETYELATTRRLKNISDLLKKKLTPLQYDIYMHNYESGNLVNARDYASRFDEYGNAMAVSPHVFLPYSRFEYELLYAAQKNVDSLKDEIFNIIIS